MSASEKLERLIDHGRIGYARSKKLEKAFPELIAVVKALEDFSGYDWHATKYLTAPLEGWRAIEIEDIEQLKESRRQAQEALADFGRKLEV